MHKFNPKKQNKKKKQKREGERGVAYNDEVCGDKKETRGTKSAPSESTEQESSCNAGKRETSDQKGRTQNEDDAVTENGGLPRGRVGLDELDCLGKGGLDVDRVDRRHIVWGDCDSSVIWD